jgi:hypothetical protein
MRRGTIIFLVVNLCIIGLLVNAFSTLIGLLFEDGSADAISRAEIPAPESDLIENRTQMIPKIIHQTYINTSIPAQWKAGQQSCIDLHDDYEYKVCLLSCHLVSHTNQSSSGQMINPASSSPQNTPGSSQHSIPTHSPSNAPMPFATSSYTSTAESTSILTMAATADSILSSPTQPGSAVPFPQESATMPWALSPNIPSSTP